MNLQNINRHKWHGGQLLSFSGLDGKTDYANAITAITLKKKPGIEIKLPGECFITFPLSAQGDFFITGDCFKLNSSNKIITGVFLDTHHLLIEGECEISKKSDAISTCSENGRTLIGTTSFFDKSKITSDIEKHFKDRSHWLAQQKLPDHLSQESQRTAAKFLSLMKTQIYTPEGHIKHPWSTPDRWPHRDMWLWDSVFHAIGWRHIDLALSKNLITAVFDTQQDDGFIAHQMNPTKNSIITQPPILALGVKLVTEKAPDRDWIESIYPKLCAYIEWDIKNRDTDGGGLLEWFIEGNENCRSGESGMDNSPRFDTATQVDAVDFNSFLALECELLGEFATLLDKKEDAEKWQKKHQQLCHLIQTKLWSEEHQFFVDYDVDKDTPSPVLASSGFLPLICGAATPQQAEHLAAHLKDPTMFDTKFPIASIAVKDADHYAKDMWRGPTWINLNWLVAYGFERYEMTNVAENIKQQTSNVIETACEKYGVAFEYFDDRNEVDPPELLRKGKCAPEASPYNQVLHDFGWTATLYMDFLYSNKTKATSPKN